MLIEVFTAHGGGRYWRRLLEEWLTAGHEIREVCAFDDVIYRKKRGTLGRFGLRFTTHISFPLKAWLKLRGNCRRKDHVRVVITSPFFLPWIAAWAQPAESRPPIINIVNDLFPDALVRAGMITSHGLVARGLSMTTRFSLKNCEASVFLGERLQAYAEQKYGRSPLARIISVGADARFVRNEPPVRSTSGHVLEIVYSGVMGHMHDTETIQQLAELGLPEHVSLTFYSSGVGYNLLQRALAQSDPVKWNRVKLHGPLGDEAWRNILIQNPVGLVTLKSGAECVSMPSKTYSALAAGQALLAICSPDSDLADLIHRHECGWVVPPGEPQRLKDLLVHLVGNPAEIHGKRIKAYQAGHSFYDMSIISRQYLDLFNSLLSRKNLLRSETVA